MVETARFVLVPDDADTHRSQRGVFWTRLHVTICERSTVRWQDTGHNGDGLNRVGSH